MTYDTPLATGLSYGILSALDPEQRKAAEILKGQVMIVGGPGSGKTRTLTHRIAHLVTSKTAKPEQCLVILLTQRACDEAMARLKKMLGKNAVRVPVLTFSQFGLMVLKENREIAGLPRGFRLAEKKERESFAVKALGWPQEKVERAIYRLSFLKRRSEIPEPRSDEAALNALLEEWREHEGWLDDEDLLCLPLKLFDDQPKIAAAYRDRFCFISVDEYQDMDGLGFRLLRHLVKSDGNLCVIGDPDQSIYQFRGSDTRFFLEFEKDFPFMHKVQLRRNYRAGDAILKASSQVIAPIHVSDKMEMTPLLGDTGPVIIYQAGTERAEAEYVVQTIEKILGEKSNLSGEIGDPSEMEEESVFSDFAVFYRTEEQADFLQAALERSGLPLRRFSLETPETDWDEKACAISLSTLHAAKGLEFHTVFITGCEDGLIPLKPAEKFEHEDLEEERRLLYLGMTRAKTRLFITHVAIRMRDGKNEEQKPSPFLKDIEKNPHESKKAKEPPSSSISEKAQLDLF